MSLVVAFCLAASAPTLSATAHGGLDAEQVRAMVTADAEVLVAERNATEAPAVVLAASGEERGFFDMYFPFTIDDNLHPEIDDNLVGLWAVTAILNLFFSPLAMIVSPLLVPKMMVELETDSDYTSEVLIGGIIHAVVFVISIPFIYLVGLGLVAILVNDLYLHPVMVINSYNAHVEGGGEKKKTKKSREVAVPDRERVAVFAY